MTVENPCRSCFSAVRACVCDDSSAPLPPGLPLSSFAEYPAINNESSRTDSSSRAAHHILSGSGYAVTDVFASSRLVRAGPVPATTPPPRLACLSSPRAARASDCQPCAASPTPCSASLCASDDGRGSLWVGPCCLSSQQELFSAGRGYLLTHRG